MHFSSLSFRSFLFAFAPQSCASQTLVVASSPVQPTAQSAVLLLLAAAAAPTAPPPCCLLLFFPRYKGGDCPFWLPVRLLCSPRTPSPAPSSSSAQLLPQFPLPAAVNDRSPPVPANQKCGQAPRAEKREEEKKPVNLMSAHLPGAVARRELASAQAGPGRQEVVFC